MVKKTHQPYQPNLEEQLAEQKILNTSLDGTACPSGRIFIYNQRSG
jgi:hypothetical protein